MAETVTTVKKLDPDFVSDFIFLCNFIVRKSKKKSLFHRGKGLGPVFFVTQRIPYCKYKKRLLYLFYYLFKHPYFEIMN